MAAVAGAATSGGPVSPPRSPRFEISPPSSRSLALLHFMVIMKRSCACAQAQLKERLAKVYEVKAQLKERPPPVSGSSSRLAPATLDGG